MLILSVITEEKEILSRWTEYCSELYNYERCGGNAVLDFSQPPEEDLQPILHEEVEIAVASLKRGKSAGVDNIPAELVQAGGEIMIDVLTEICNRIWRTGELNISYKDHVTNEEVRRKIQAAIGEYDELLTLFKKRKLR